MDIVEKVLQLKQDFDDVYEAGKSAGGSDNFYDTFWDNYQDYGDRTNYERGFWGSYWNENNFKPKYPLKPINASSMFQDCLMPELNYTLDLSECTNAGTIFAYADTITIKDLIVNENLSLENSFRACYQLVNLGIRGTIGKSISLNWSKNLSDESVNKVIGCLKDLTGQTAETLTVHKTVGEKLTDTQKATITAKNWILSY